MTERKRLILLILIMVNSALAVGGVAIIVLYRTAMSQTKERLVETAQSQARLIEAVARFDALNSKDFPEGSQAATLSQVIDAHKNYKGFGETGEFTLARREAGQIVFLLSHRHLDQGTPKPVPFDSSDSKLAEPMRRALKGMSGTVVGLDYRGETVLAAYEPVAELDLGIVAKIDLSEVRAPFLEAALSGLGIALLVVFFGSVVFWKLSEPMIRNIRDREARLSAILNTAIEGIITINTQGIIESVNPAAEKMFGYTSSEMIGGNVNILMPSPYREEHDGYLAHYLETGEAKIIGIGREAVALRKDGSNFSVELAVSEVGHLGSFTGVIRDITERKEAEAKIMQAERLSAIGEAMTGLMHESRNALQRSQASLERLGRRVQDRPEVMEFLDDLQEAQDDLHRLYEEVREFAAPIKIKPKRCRLDEIVRQAWGNLEQIHNGRKVRLQEQGIDIDLHCNVDEFEIRQVFRNILENGIGACPDPGKIEVQFTETVLDDSPAVCIATRNNGPPFTPDEQKHIFDAFYTTKTHGTGLGMAIVKRIVEAHGGHVVLGPDPDQIAEILITLPRKSS